MTMFGYWIAHVTYGYSAIDWHRERIDNSWALALAMGGLVLAVYFCYSLHGVTLLYDPVTQLSTPSNPVTPNLTLNLSLKHSTPTPKHLPQSKTLTTFSCQIFSTEDIGPFDSSFHSLSNGVSLVINFFKSKNLYRRYRSIQKLFESSIQRCIIWPSHPSGYIF